MLTDVSKKKQPKICIKAWRTAYFGLYPPNSFFTAATLHTVLQAKCPAK